MALGRGRGGGSGGRTGMTENDFYFGMNLSGRDRKKLSKTEYNHRTQQDTPTSA
uniref:Uncharacterized protein n=1 Tax=Oryza sativa subsp. japonica TaxID=39947 RepID=Q2QUL4_ORYSJ|nr:hypothetical protein LOC_Os12g15860 [Oryza sativa Japonica Group]